MPAYQQARLLISGYVQGVGYRYFVLTCARQYALTGWVRNLTDGRVEVTAEGPAGLMADFIQDLRRGPRAASVEDVAVEWRPYTGEFTGFIIEH